MGIDHLSPSTAQSYRTCGRQVYFSKVMGVVNPVGYAMTDYGSSMHKAIEMLYKNKLQEEEFKKVFEAEWEKLSKEVTNWKTDTKEHLLEQGLLACEDFYKNIYGKYKVKDVEQKFNISRGKDKFPIVCYADAITEDSVIIDYKFGRGMYGLADSKSYMLNMATYMWGYLESCGEVPLIVFIKEKWRKLKDKETGKYKFYHDSFVIDEKKIQPEELDYYKSIYDGVEAGIKANVWLPAPDDSFLCKSCGYRLNGMCNRKVAED